MYWWVSEKTFQSVLKRAVDYYTHHGSHVFCAFIDFSKAFESVNYWLLFCKLIDNNNTVQCCMTVRLLAYWYRNLQLFVRWQNAVSDPFLMSNGVRQGGILSPFLFRFYIRDLITKLTNTGFGCNNRGTIINVLCYADDMVLLAPSWAALQYLLNVLEAESVSINMSFNTKKDLCCIQSYK